MHPSRGVGVSDLRVRPGIPRATSSYWLVLALGLGACALPEEEDLALEQSLQAAVVDEARTAYPRRDAGTLLDGGGPIVDAGGPALDGGPITSDGGPVIRDGGPRPDGGPSSFEPVGMWLFDDCSPGSTLLVDSSPSGANATRSASVGCAAGVLGAGLLFDDRKDTVESTNAAFALGGAMTAAAWLNPQSTQAGSVLSKQQQNSSAFELTYSRNKVTFSVTLQKPRGTQVVSSSVTIPLATWTHIAGVYDGQFVRLFRNGQQVGQVSAPGTIADVSGPVRIGNNRNSQFFRGQLDEVRLFNRGLLEFEVGELSCIRKEPTLAVTPVSGPAVEPDVTVHYDVAYTNNNGGGCQPGSVVLQFDESPPDGFSVSVPQNFQQVDAGQTALFSVDVTGSSDAAPGTQLIPFSMFDFSAPTPPLAGQLSFTLNEPTGCFVRTGRELLMRDLSVVEDPVRTTFSTAGDPRSGVWTFARLMEQLAPSPEQAPALVEQMLESWLSDQTINGFTVPSRTQLAQLVLNPWPRTESGALDLERAPLRLLAILNRLDLRDLAKQQAGEGRFVFGVLDAAGNQQEFTIILEYRLPATTTADVLDWANQWHALGALPFPSEQYNAALQALTTRFAGRDADPGRTNGSALKRLRTNEIALTSRWELREFTLSAATGMLVQSTVELTPDTEFMNDSPLVADYVNQNEAAILIEQHTLPETFQGTPFLGGSSFNDLAGWHASGIVNPEARFRFSLNTCNGCHSAEETGTFFLHISNRQPGQTAPLSSFMTGITIRDPVTGNPRTLNDLGRRNADLRAVVCGGTASTLTTPLPTTASRMARAPEPSRESFLSKGIGRVH